MHLAANAVKHRQRVRHARLGRVHLLREAVAVFAALGALHLGLHARVEVGFGKQRMLLDAPREGVKLRQRLVALTRCGDVRHVGLLPRGRRARHRLAAAPHLVLHPGVECRTALEGALHVAQRRTRSVMRRRSVGVRQCRL